jgi:RNA polymerase sigma-70 factor (ECF subfamily)
MITSTFDIPCSIFCRSVYNLAIVTDPDFDLGACLSGDKKAWDAFVERFAPVIFAAITKVLQPARRGDAHGEDLCQEVFLRLVRDDYRLLGTFDESRASLTTWLTVISRSTAIDSLRRRRLPTINLADDAAQALEPAQAPSPADPPSQIELPSGLLSPRQELVLHLLFDSQMEVEQVAALLGVDAQTVRSTKHKAILRLRAHFDTG